MMLLGILHGLLTADEHRSPVKRRRRAQILHVVSMGAETKRQRRRRTGKSRGERQHEARAYLTRFGK